MPTTVTMQPSSYAGFTVFTIHAETRAECYDAAARITASLGGSRVEDFRAHVEHEGWAELEVQDAPMRLLALH